MNTTRITSLLQAQSVCNDLYNELNNFAYDNSNNIELIVTLLDSLNSNLKLVFDDSSDIFILLSKSSNIIKKINQENISSIKDSINTLLSVISSTIFKNIESEISTEKIIEKSISDDLLSYIFSIPFDISNVEQLALDICVKSGITNPLKSFNNSMKLMETYPNMLSNENYAHPEYVYEPTKQREFIKCPVCQGEGKPYFNAFSYRMVNFRPPFQPFKLWMCCTNCSNLYTYRYPEEFLKQSDNSSLVTPDNDAYLTTTGITTSTTLAIWNNILEKLSSYTSGRDLLEVGIGRGELIAVALELGYDIDAVELVTSSAQEISNMLGVPIWNGDFLKYTSDKKYSIITMGDIIEHVTAPAEALKNAHSLLADDGVLWLSTPNYESAFSRMLKFNDPMWSEPEHITYFSYVGLANLAEKCGFKVVDYQISNRYNGSMELILVKNK